MKKRWIKQGLMSLLILTMSLSLFGTAASARGMGALSKESHTYKITRQKAEHEDAARAEEKAALRREAEQSVVREESSGKDSSFSGHTQAAESDASGAAGEETRAGRSSTESGNSTKSGNASESGSAAESRDHTDEAPGEESGMENRSAETTANAAESADREQGEESIPSGSETLPDETTVPVVASSSEIQESDAVSSVTDYILRHMDRSKAGNAMQMVPYDYMSVTYQIVNAGLLDEVSIDGLWSDRDGDGESDYWQALLMQDLSHVMIYRGDADAKYDVAKVGAMVNGGRMADWIAARNDNTGTVFHDFIVDKAAGLVYIPRSYSDKTSGGERIVGSVRMQVMYAVSRNMPSARVNVSVNAENIRGKVAEHGSASNSVLDTSTELKIAKDRTARKNIRQSSIDSVQINGIPYDKDSGAWSYDRSSGVMTISASPLVIGDVDVEISNTIAKSAKDAAETVMGTLEAKAALSDYKDIPWSKTSGGKIAEWNFDFDPKEKPGSKNAYQAYLTAKGTMDYDVHSSSSYVWGGVYSGLSSGNKKDELRACRVVIEEAAAKAFDAKKEVKDYHAMGGHDGYYQLSGILGKVEKNSEGGYTYHKQTVKVHGNGQVVYGKVTIPVSRFNMSCAHAGVPADVSSVHADNEKYNSGDAGDQIRNFRLRFYAFGKADDQYDYAIVGLCSPTVRTQAGVAFFKVRIPHEEKICLQVNKKSGNETLTNGLKCYSLEGTTYDLSVKNGSSYAAVDSFALDEDGDSARVDIEAGKTYHLTETIAGNGYRKSDHVTEIQISSDGKSATVDGKKAELKPFGNAYVLTVNLTNEPGTVPLALQIAKKGAANTALAGAEFRVRYYNGFYTSVDSVPPMRTWMYQTDDQGRVDLETTQPLSGSDPLFVVNRAVCCPYGTITIEETKAPGGYLNDGVFTADGTKIGSMAVIRVDSSGLHSAGTGNMPISSLTCTDTHIPVPHTSLRAEDGTQYRKAEKNITLTDFVTLDGCDSLKEAGKTLTVEGVLYDRSEEKILTIDGKEIRASTTVTVDENTETVKNVFTFDASSLAGRTVAAMETVRMDGSVLTKHDDLNDTEQMVYFPKIKTEAKDAVTKSHISLGEGTIRIADTVSYSNLKPGQKYSLTGTLHEQVMDEDGTVTDGGVLKDKSGKNITATSAFTASDRGSGTAEVTFAFEAPEDLAGRTSVAFEEIPGLAVHANITDSAQTIRFPGIHTTAVADSTGEPLTEAATDVSLTDMVTYEKLTPGLTYTLTGTMMEQSSGKKLVGEDGKAISRTVSFIPEKENGQIEVRFDHLDLTKVKPEGMQEDWSMAGKNAVFFEVLKTPDGATVAHHEAIEDEKQTIHIPGGSTEAKAEDGSHYVPAAGEQTVQDAVSYRNLLPDKEYTVTGTLMLIPEKDGEEVKPLMDARGNPVTSTVTFTTPKAKEEESGVNGTVEIPFTFDASRMAGRAIAAFESCRRNGTEVFAHDDIHDTSQTIYIPDGHTTLISCSTQSHISNAAKRDTLIDTIDYKGLRQDTLYTAVGTLMDRNTGKALKEANGDSVTKSVTFRTPASEGGAMTVSGNVNVQFTLNASGLAGKTVAAFEDVYEGERAEGKTVFSHQDIDDSDQSVTYPKIRTSAEDGKDGDKTIMKAKKVRIRDTVRYTGLLPGEKYTMSGTLVSKKSGKVLKAGGRKVTAETGFTPDKTEGTVDVILCFDASGVDEGSFVVFEQCRNGKGALVASHEDLTDAGQTVHIKVPKDEDHSSETDHPDETDSPNEEDSSDAKHIRSVKTGDSSGILLLALICAASAGAGAVLLRKNKDR